MNVSLTGTGIIALVVTQLLSLAGIDDNGTSGAAITGFLTFVAWVALVWGQLRRKDLVAGFFRK